MNGDIGGILWFVLDVIAVGILALAVLVAYRSYQEKFSAPLAAERNRQLDGEAQRLRRS